MCGIIMFGADQTMKACVAEVKQIHIHNTFMPKHQHELTTKQKAQMVELFIFLTEKRSGEIERCWVETYKGITS